VGLQEGEQIMTLVLTQYRRATDGETDTLLAKTRASIASRR